MDKVVGIIKKIEPRPDGALCATILGVKSWDLKDRMPLEFYWPVSSSEKVGDEKIIHRSDLVLELRRQGILPG